MKLRKPFLFIPLILLLAACRDANQYPPTQAPLAVTSAPTTDPTLATVAATVVTPTVNPTMLAQTPSGIESGGGTYINSTGKLSFVYPQGWVVQETGGQINIANNSGALAGVPGSGQFLINIVVSPIGELTLDSSDTTQAGISARDALLQLSETYAVGDTTVSEPFEENMGGRQTFFVRISNASNEALLGIVDVNGTHIALTAVAARGELNLVEPVARTLGASLQYTP